MKLSTPVWCRRCVCAHPEGHHRKSIEAAASIVARKPVKTPQLVDAGKAGAVTWKGADTAVTLSGSDAYGKPVREVIMVPKKVAKAMVQAAKPKKTKRRPPKDGKFSKDYFQMCYMATRREADAAGFGGSRTPGDPRYNPKYKTVNEYNAMKAKKKPAPNG